MGRPGRDARAGGRNGFGDRGGRRGRRPGPRSRRPARPRRRDGPCAPDSSQPGRRSALLADDEGGGVVAEDGIGPRGASGSERSRTTRTRSAAPWRARARATPWASIGSAVGRRPGGVGDLDGPGGRGRWLAVTTSRVVPGVGVDDRAVVAGQGVQQSRLLPTLGRPARTTRQPAQQPARRPAPGRSRHPG